jgi:hypothetical protein
MNKLFYLVARALGMVAPSILGDWGYLGENPNRTRPHKTKSKRNPEREAKLARQYRKRYEHMLTIVVTEKNRAKMEQRRAS